MQTPNGTAVQLSESIGHIMETVLVKGDLSVLSPEQRTQYYHKVCESIGLNPLTKPFEYLDLGGKLTLYAKKDATDQLRMRHGVSVLEMTETIIEGQVCVWRCKVQMGDRTDVASGAVTLSGLKGDALANALMRGETKAKRRATLSICGLGMIDETEIETIPSAKTVAVDDSGVIADDVVEMAEKELDGARIVPAEERPTPDPHATIRAKQGIDQPDSAPTEGNHDSLGALVSVKMVPFKNKPGRYRYFYAVQDDLQQTRIELVSFYAPECMPDLTYIPDPDGNWRNDKTVGWDHLTSRVMKYHYKIGEYNGKREYAVPDYTANPGTEKEAKYAKLSVDGDDSSGYSRLGGPDGPRIHTGHPTRRIERTLEGPPDNADVPPPPEDRMFDE